MKIAAAFQKNHSAVISSIRQVEKTISDPATFVGSTIAKMEIAIYESQR